MSGHEVICIEAPVPLTESLLADAPVLSLCPPALRPALRFIVSHLPVGYIFLACTQSAAPHLLVVCNPQCEHKLTELEPLVELALVSCPVSFTLHSYSTITNMLAQGHVYYSGCCRVNNLLYMKAGLAFPALSNGRYQQVLLAAGRFEQGIGKALSFYEHAASQLELPQRGLAAFCLHQACEQSFRILFLSLRGRELRSHSPRVLYRHAQTFAAFRGIFGNAPAEEQRLLSLLEEAYSGSRYDESYRIGHTDLLKLFDVVGLVIGRCCDTFSGFIDNALAGMRFES
ncbi:hypothetical protein C7T94_16935 [Pedobacter yulinensis]|uniref:HEPN domain-containing protein n=1 Tax=Pedobacter yulinensis TaxID=2126353 RepID=A0A2T3HHG9_9SPHI|nr:HEPN domain-containing protein [Pedobacter yulinensis]PST81885.1 hypothetical protein C7T94_16935 [Pedobacter yulinensis]